MADKRKAPFFMGLLFFCVGAAAMIGSVLIYRSDSAFFSGATETPAVIVDKFVVSRAHKRDRMSLRYSFEVDGRAHEGFERWTGETEAFHALSEGDEIVVAYLAEMDATDPPSRLVTGGRQDFMTSMFVVGVLFAGVGSLLALKARRLG